MCCLPLEDTGQDMTKNKFKPNIRKKWGGGASHIVIGIISVGTLYGKNWWVAFDTPDLATIPTVPSSDKIPPTLTIASLTEKPTSSGPIVLQINFLVSGRHLIYFTPNYNAGRKCAPHFLYTSARGGTLRNRSLTVIRRTESDIRHFVSSDTLHVCLNVTPWNAANKRAFRRDVPLPYSGCSSDRKIQSHSKIPHRTATDLPSHPQHSFRSAFIV